MNSERVFKIITSDLTSDIMKDEEELERIINSDIEIEDKINTVKNLLKRISIAELSITKFNNMVNPTNKID